MTIRAFWGFGGDCVACASPQRSLISGLRARRNNSDHIYEEAVSRSGLVTSATLLYA